jgi:hypothetical protein
LLKCFRTTKTQNAGWDRQLLAIELKELEVLLPEVGLDVGITGFAPAEVDSLMVDLGPPWLSGAVAVHNHVLRANPATFYMHIGGHGDPEKLATALRTGLAASKTPLTAPTPPASQPRIDLDTSQLDQIIGAKGQANGGVYQFGVPRRDPVSEHGVRLDPAGPMGVATAINFQPTGGGKAAITGDFVLTGDEVNDVVKALRSNGIEVTASSSFELTRLHHSLSLDCLNQF